MRSKLWLLLTLQCGLWSCSNNAGYLQNGYPAFVRVNGSYAYTANGELGLDIIDLNNLRTVHRMLPQREMHSIDAMSIDGNLLFLIDARGEDYLAVYDVSNPVNPQLIDGPIGVNGGPFTGVSAAGGNVVVSGGTTHLNYFKYTSGGKLSNSEAIFGRDRGHPDVLLSNDGQVAYLSTDFNGLVDDAEYGVVTVALGDLATSPVLLSEIGIPGSGFTEGTTQPSGFPIKTAILSDDVLLVAHGVGLSIIDLVQGRILASMRTVDIGIAATNLAIYQSIAYVVGNSPSPTLVKVDLSDIANPSVIETVPLNTSGGIPTSVAVTDQLVLIAANEGGLMVMNR